MQKYKNCVSVIESHKGCLLKINKLGRLWYLWCDLFKWIFISGLLYFAFILICLFFLGKDPLFKLNLGIKWVWKGNFIDYLTPIPVAFFVTAICFLITYAIKERDINLLLYGGNKFRVWRNKPSQLEFEGTKSTELVIAYSEDKRRTAGMKKTGEHIVGINVADFVRGEKQALMYEKWLGKHYYTIDAILYDNDFKKVSEFRKKHGIRDCGTRQ